MTEYGRLAVELEDSLDPTRQEWLRARLAELDTIFDRAAASAPAPFREGRP